MAKRSDEAERAHRAKFSPEKIPKRARHRRCPAGIDSKNTKLPGMAYRKRDFPISFSRIRYRQRDKGNFHCQGQYTWFATLRGRATLFRRAVVQFARMKSGWTPIGIGAGGSLTGLRWLTVSRLPPLSLCSFGRLYCRRSTSRNESPYADSKVDA